MKKVIRLSKSSISSEEKTAVLNVLDKEFLGMGEEVMIFEERLTSYFGRNTVCVVNGTSALQLALQSCGIGYGDEVLVPSLTYVASFQAISATGAKPIACDINEQTLLIDLEDAQQKLTENTKAIMPVFYSGDASNIFEVYDFASKNKIRVIEDAAHAFGSVINSKKVGSFGDISCFSFDGIKNITSGEGGCIVTSDPKVLQIIKDVRLLGVEKDTEKRFTGQRSWEFDVTAQGWRYHMSNIMAAIGIKQLEKFAEKAERRKYLAKKYDNLFIGNPNIYTFKRDYNSIVPHIYVIRIKGLKNRSELQKKLLAENVQTGIHYQPNHKLTYYHNSKNNNLPITDLLFPELLSIPLHPDLQDEDIDIVVNTLNNILPDFL
jgi:dTDP-4-amino-4,6-dideoxygalactose transaminase